MIPNVTKGRNFRGLLAYLVRQGRSHEEHTNPHLVAGDQSIMGFHSRDELGLMEALKVADELAAPAKTHKRDRGGPQVWHCSLSLNPGEKQLSDDKWAEIAEEFVAEMGFIGQAGLKDCRWVAVRHGLASNDRDHIHIAVSLVRGPDSKAEYKDDHDRSQLICRELEKNHGLVQLESAQHGSVTRATKRGERARKQRERIPETHRERLERIVRACAVAASSEDDFVQRLRDTKVLVSVRHAKGRTDAVVGYSVAMIPRKGQEKVWYKGGDLARDLTLPRLRQTWAATAQADAAAERGSELAEEVQPDGAAAATTQWEAATRGEPLSQAPDQPDAADPQAWQRCIAEVAELREHLRSIPDHDRVAWARVAGDLAGVFNAWSLQVERAPGPLAATATSLARSAQLRAHEVRGRYTSIPPARRTARLLAAMSSSAPAAGQAALLRQLASAAKALHDAHVVEGHTQRAADISDTVRTQLAVVQAGLERQARPPAGHAPSGPPRSPATRAPIPGRARDRPDTPPSRQQPER